jgi:hypothetical protein
MQPEEELEELELDGVAVGGTGVRVGKGVGVELEPLELLDEELGGVAVAVGGTGVGVGGIGVAVAVGVGVGDALLELEELDEENGLSRGTPII